MADLRWADAVHVANPHTGQAEQFRKGQPAPEWVTELIADGLLTEDLVEEAGVGALPVAKPPLQKS